MKRKPLNNKPRTQLKRNPLKKKPASPEKIAKDKEDKDKMWEVYNEHWNLTWKKWYNNGDWWPLHICEECKCTIWGENKSLYHHHLLEKGMEKYEHLKYEMDNLILLCGECHSKVTNGYPGPVVQQRTKEAKQKFNII